MKSKVFIRLLASALIAFICYASWAYYANSLVTNDQHVLIKSALVQGIYSGGITLFFTLLLEVFYRKFGAKTYFLPFIMPRINAQHSLENRCSTLEMFKASLQMSKRDCKGTYLPGELLSPLPALAIQTILVIAVNIAFETPNLWLTVAPSIIFSAIYGYVYSFALARKEMSTA